MCKEYLIVGCFLDYRRNMHKAFRISVTYYQKVGGYWTLGKKNFQTVSEKRWWWWWWAKVLNDDYFGCAWTFAPYLTKKEGVHSHDLHDKIPSQYPVIKTDVLSPQFYAWTDRSGDHLSCPTWSSVLITWEHPLAVGLKCWRE